MKLEYIHETSQIAKPYQDNVSRLSKSTLATLVLQLTPLA